MIAAVPAYIALSVICFSARVIVFAASYGAVEHDSGWALGVAQNLALRGIYASYTNPIRDDSPGPHPSIHERFSVQDAQGFSYFPGGVAMGSGYVVPEAVVIKLFGPGFWQYRLWPLLAFVLLLTAVFWLVWRIGGLPALIALQMWLWAVPQFTTQFAYEAFSEHIALLFLLLAFVALSYGGESRGAARAISGFRLGLAYLTKSISVLSGAGVLPLIAWQLYMGRRDLRRGLARWALFGGSILAPIAAYELYRFVSLTSTFGIESWYAINEDIRLHALSAGSGLSLAPLLQPDVGFILNKLDIWRDLGASQSVVLWVGLLLSPLVFVRRAARSNLPILGIMWCGAMLTFAWFVLLSANGWARHAWPSLFLAMMLLCIAGGLLLRACLDSRNLSIACALGLVLFGLYGVRYESLELRPVLDQETIESWLAVRNLRGPGLGLPSHTLLSFADQVELISFFGNGVAPEDRVYYLDQFLNAEASTLVDRVFYTADRYKVLGQRNAAGGESYLIFGPYQRGPAAITSDTYMADRLREYCGEIVFRNPSYLLCRLKTGPS
ncbi:MAG: hypothetical protein EXR58_06380 [Chloroflexi bacterium]|nr:hypothetical protein [Chloroflexota bacterium]